MAHRARTFLSLNKLIALFLSVMLLPNVSLASKVALVIGNSAYEHTTPLANPRNDAEAIAKKLRLLGFETVEGYDLPLREMSLKIRDFARASKSAELSVVFYAGHGMALNGENYLLPIDAVMQDETALDWELIPLSMITDQFDATKGAHLLLLDSCRDNPLAGKLAVASGRGTRSASLGGMAMVDVPNSGYGTGIAFATSPGAVAADGAGKHSPFTEALLTHLGTANKSVSSIMNSVKSDVQTATDKVQIPWFQSSFTSDIYLNVREEPATAAVTQPPVQAAAPAPAATAAASDDEVMFWNFAQENKDVESYQLYLDQYPTGRFAPLARLSLEKLKSANAQVQTASVASDQVGGQTAYRSLASTPLQTPLVLKPTAYLYSQPANQQTETLISFGSKQFRERNKVIQARISAAGYSVGAVDGAIGPGTRGKIRAWQTGNGLPPTGYLNMVQMHLLYSQTEDTYAAFLANSTKSYSSSSGGGSSKKNNAGKFFQGVANNFARGLGQGIGSK